MRVRVGSKYQHLVGPLGAGGGEGLVDLAVTEAELAAGADRGAGASDHARRG